MMPDESEDAELNAAAIWRQPSAALTWALPQQQPFRRDAGQEEIEILFLPDEDNTQNLTLRWIHKSRHGQPDCYPRMQTALDSIKPGDLPFGARISFWGQNDLLARLQEQAEAQSLTLYDTALRFTVASVPENIAGWRYHPALGFGKI
jgi:CRISPR-associated endonuclease/helicase Cas3